MRELIYCDKEWQLKGLKFKYIQETTEQSFLDYQCLRERKVQ